MVKTKKFKFAIVVDEYGRSKKNLKKLLVLLKEEFPYLTQQKYAFCKKLVKDAKVNDVILFGSSSKYDIKVVTEEVWEELSESSLRYVEYQLSEDWVDIVDRLHKYAESNYPDKYEEEDDECCAEYEVIVLEEEDDDYYVSRRPRNKKRTKKQTKRLVLEDMDVFHNFVKVGWDVYDIYLNEDDEEFVKIDGNTYWIDRDSWGNGKVSVR